MFLIQFIHLSENTNTLETAFVKQLAPSQYACLYDQKYTVFSRKSVISFLSLSLNICTGLDKQKISA